MKLICEYIDEHGTKHSEVVTPGEAISIIRYGDKNATTAKIYATDGTLKGERNTGEELSLPEVYRHWWHDDDLQQLELLPDSHE